MTSDQIPSVVSAAQPAGGQVTVQPDGHIIFTHGHRYPDNVQCVTQIYRPDGSLQSVHVILSGFVGPVLDVTATFDAAGKLLREEGYRAAGVKEPVSSFILPLPKQPVVTQAAPAPAPAAALQELSTLSGFEGLSAPPAVKAPQSPEQKSSDSTTPDSTKPKP